MSAKLEAEPDGLDNRWNALMRRFDKLLDKDEGSTAKKEENIVSALAEEKDRNRDEESSLVGDVNCIILVPLHTDGRTTVGPDVVVHSPQESLGIQHREGPSLSYGEDLPLKHSVSVSDEGTLPTTEHCVEDLVQTGPTIPLEHVSARSLRALTRAQDTVGDRHIHRRRTSTGARACSPIVLSSRLESDVPWEPGTQSSLSSCVYFYKSGRSSSSENSYRTRWGGRQRNGRSTTESSESSESNIASSGRWSARSSERQVPCSEKEDRTWKPRGSKKLQSLQEVPNTRQLRSQKVQVTQGMGKEKETFEVWSLPRNRKKLATRAEHSVKSRREDSSLQEKDKFPESNVTNLQGNRMRKLEMQPTREKNVVEGSFDEGKQPTGRTPRISSANRSEEGITQRALVLEVGANVQSVAMPPPTGKPDSDSDFDYTTPQYSRSQRKNVIPGYKKKGRQEQRYLEDYADERIRPELANYPSTERRKKLQSAPMSPSGRDDSNSGNTKRVNLNSECENSYSSASPIGKRKGKRIRREHRRRRSYSISEDEFHYKMQETERRRMRRYDARGDWDYGEDFVELSRYGARRNRRRSNSEEGGAEIADYELWPSDMKLDDDFAPPGGRQRELVMKTPKPSTIDKNAKRRERRHKQKDREQKIKQRENQGLKRHYIAVDEHGEPYGYGKGSWRQELNNLCSSLDPSVIDIRWQPEEAMKLLRSRLKEHFEYSAPVSKAYIRSLAGRNVTQRRNKIINSMVDGALCPSGMNPDIWRRIRQNPRREELSQRMRYANSCRRQLGRTGPKGISGVREDLPEKLGREADPDELEDELRRDKGYSGRPKKSKEKLKVLQLPSHLDCGPAEKAGTGGSGSEASEQDIAAKESSERIGALDGTREKEYIRALEKRIKELTAQKGGDEVGPRLPSGVDVGPSAVLNEAIHERDGEVDVLKSQEDGDRVEGNGMTTEVKTTTSAPKKRRGGRR